MLSRRLIEVAFFVASFPVAACSYPPPDSLAVRLRDAKNVFLAQVQKVEFHISPGLDEKRATLWEVAHDGQPARSMWWDGIAAVGPIFRGHPSPTINLRFSSNWCAGVRFLPGEWYLFAVGDIGHEIVVTISDMEAVRHISGHSLPELLEPAFLNPISKSINEALDQPSAGTIERLERISETISVAGRPPSPSSSAEHPNAQH